MATRTEQQYKTLYGSSGTIFPDNTTAQISEGDVRAFGEDSADSLVFLTNMSVKAINTSGASAAINLNSGKSVNFAGDTIITSAFTFSISNTTNASYFNLIFAITGVPVITFPGSAWLMNDIRWNNGARTWTPVEEGLYKLTALWNGTYWFVDISQSSYS